MDQQTFQVIASLFGLLLTVIGYLLAQSMLSLRGALRSHKEDVDTLRRDHTALALEIAKNYMPRTELEKKLDDIFALLEDIRKEVRHA
jgi:hypothetical protein